MRVLILSQGSYGVYETIGLTKALASLGFEVDLGHPNRFAVTMGAASVLSYDGQLLQLPDFVLVRMGSGTSSHAATIIRQFEALGVPVVNSLSAIQAAMDKGYTMQAAAAAGLPIPKTMIYTAKDDVVANWNSYPCILKVATGSRGNGVLRCDDPIQLKASIGLMRALDPKRTFLIQEYLGDRPGRDVRVLIIGGRAVGAMMRISINGDFRANISRGGRGESFAMSPELIALSEKSAALLGLQIAGVDLLFSGDDFVLCEVNGNPGFKGFQTYCGLDVAGKIAGYVERVLTSKVAGGLCNA